MYLRHLQQNINAGVMQTFVNMTFREIEYGIYKYVVIKVLHI